MGKQFQSMEFLQCSGSECGLRFPSAAAEMNGEFCPRCGEPAVIIASSSQTGMSQGADTKYPRTEISLLLDNIRSAYNVGSIFRTANGAGLKHLYLCGITPSPKHVGVSKTSLGSEKTLPYSQHSNGFILAKELLSSGHHLLALENTNNSRSLFECHIEPDESPLVLVLGSEKAGIDPDIISLCHDVVMLPMLGSKDSLNVAVAFGIAIYQLRFGQQKQSDRHTVES